jgi:hypothetical protein
MASVNTQALSRIVSGERDIGAFEIELPSEIIRSHTAGSLTSQRMSARLTSESLRILGAGRPGEVVLIKVFGANGQTVIHMKTIIGQTPEIILPMERLRAHGMFWVSVNRGNGRVVLPLVM